MRERRTSYSGFSAFVPYFGVDFVAVFVAVFVARLRTVVLTLLPVFFAGTGNG